MKMLRSPFPRRALQVTTALLVLSLLGGCPAKPRTVSEEAAALFSTAERHKGAGGSLMIDLDGLRAQRLLPEGAGDEGSWVTDLALTSLTAMAAAVQEPQGTESALRAAVLLGMLREWNAWPKVQRLGVFAAMPGDLTNPLSIADSAVIALAVRGDRAENEALLAGLLALDKTSGQPALKAWEDRLCLGVATLALSVCMEAGPGLLLFGSERALDTLKAEVAQHKAEPRSTAPPEVLVRARVNLVGQGSGEIVVDWKQGLRLATRLELASPEMATALERWVNDALKRLDDERASRRTALAPVLAQTRAALEKDPTAPEGLKRAAKAVSVERVMDPTDSYAAIRASLRVSRTDHSLEGEVTLPQAQLRKLVAGSGLWTSLALTGMASAIALPSLARSGSCDAKQVEGQSALRGVLASQQRYLAEHGRYASTYAELGFTPPSGARYTVCMNEACEQYPCSSPTAAGAGFKACAVANLDDDTSDFDVWLVDERGSIEHAEDDCG